MAIAVGIFSFTDIPSTHTHTDTHTQLPNSQILPGLRVALGLGTDLEMGTGHLISVSQPQHTI